MMIMSSIIAIVLFDHSHCLLAQRKHTRVSRKRVAG